MLRDPCSRVRHNAASALGRIGSAAARVEGALREALEDEDLYARKLAGIALERLGKSGERGAE
jgi:HEAT repeat protein